MPAFDAARDEVVLRIVFDGLAFVDKSENLRSIERLFGTRALTSYTAPAITASGRTLYFDWLELDIGFIDDRRARCQLISVPGQFALTDRRVFLLRHADSVVFVCESSRAGAFSGRRAFRSLERVIELAHQGLPVVLQANMQDRDSAIPPEDVVSILQPRLALAAAVGASAQLDDGVRNTFFLALSAARDRARSMIERAGIGSLPTHVASPANLLAAMQDPAVTQDAIARLAWETALQQED